MFLVISFASFRQWFLFGTNETASFIIHDYPVRVFLTKWHTVHDAAWQSNVSWDNRRCTKASIFLDWDQPYHTN